MRMTLAIAAIAGLGACAEAELAALGETLAYDNLAAGVQRAFADEYLDKPFDTGRVYVVAEEHGDLHTYSLTPCLNGTHICGGSGGVGHLQRTADYFVVTGAYPGRTFYLSPGGDGVLKWRGVNRDLAWN